MEKKFSARFWLTTFTWIVFLVSACTTSVQNVTATTTEASPTVLVAATPAFETPTPPFGTPTIEPARVTAPATATDTAKSTDSTPTEIPTITFTTTSGEKVSMPEFTGDQAVENALHYVADHALYVSGDIRTTDWDTVRNPKAMNMGKLIRSIQGYQPGGPYADSVSTSYTKIYCAHLTNGTVIFFQDVNKDVQTIYLDGVDATTLNNDLQNHKVRIPSPSPTTTP